MGTGVEQREIVLERAANGLLYPTDPALAAVGAPRDLKPVAREEVGASWYRGDAPEAAFGTGTTQPLAAGSSLAQAVADAKARSEEHTSELQSLMRISYAVFCLNKKRKRYMIKKIILYNQIKNSTH